MMKRRNFLAGSAAAGLLTWVPGPAPTGSVLTSKSASGRECRAGRSGPWCPWSGQVQPVDELVTPDTVSALDRGLDWLAGRQVRSGSLGGSFGTSGYASGVAVTALAGLAFLCQGSTPVAGRHASSIRGCTAFILRNTSDRGYIASDSTRYSNMYGHGYGMLYLSQILGMSGSAEVLEKLKRAVDMTCDVQNDQGGWRYQPQKQPGDLSVTICQIMALRAAHDAGLQVSAEVRDKTIRYVEMSQNPDGSFKYMLQGGRVSLALTAAGVVSLYSAGIYEGPRVDKALSWLNQRRPGSGQSVSPMNYFYAHYYAVQAMWHAQLQHPEYWNQWYPAIRDELLGRRDDRGFWPDSRVGPEFGTAMACIILQIPFNYLPVFAP